MENKYYTPELSEFFEGFEFQYQDIEHAKWISDVYRLDWEVEESGIYEYLDWGNIRVKCLDQEDIESLGFKLDPIRSYLNYRNSFSLINEPYKLSLDHIYNENKIILRGHKVDYPTKTLFEGIIKNLSELKKLLKQTKNYE